jgi:SPP1 family predicted phage head-tail adaptor
MPNIRAGDLDRRITIQVATETRDAANDPVKEWNPADFFKLWAKKVDQRGFETAAAQQLVRTADTVFTIRQSDRARSIYPESHRIELDGKLFTIISVQESKMRGDCLELLTSSRPDGVGARGVGQTSE